MQKHRWHALPVAAVLLLAGACSNTDASPGEDETTAAPPVASSSASPTETASQTDQPEDPMAQEAIEAYRDFRDDLNQFAQDGFPAEEQGELRLHASDGYADTLLGNWDTGRDYSLHQEGSINVESIEVVSQDDSEEKLTLAACEDFSEVELLDSEGESVGDIAEGNSLTHVSMQLMEDRYQGEDIWVITDNRAQQDEEC